MSNFWSSWPNPWILHDLRGKLCPCCTISQVILPEIVKMYFYSDDEDCWSCLFRNVVAISGQPFGKVQYDRG